MLNLSDKELDRLSKEAAQEYEPGDVLGPRSWEKLEPRLDNNPGGFNPNTLRHIRRFPFYYAPALLVLMGVSYYFIKQGTKGSGSPPTFGMAKTPPPTEKNASAKNPVYPDKSTPLSSSSVNPSSPGASGGSDSRVATAGSNSGSKAGFDPLTATGSNAAANAVGSSDRRSPPQPGSRHKISGHNGALGQTGLAAGHSALDARQSTDAGQGTDAIANNADAAGTRAGTHAGTTGTRTGANNNPSRELNRSATGRLASTKSRVLIPDSNLRKFTLKSLPQGVRPRALHIKRDLQIGLVLAPDFTSVNSLSGNRPGSTVGLTVDYQFANHWYIGSGLLLDRKNYAAQAKDYHAPPNFYQNVFARHLDYVKGTFEMLEIPLNLRYDFSVTGSTLFFATAGISSYLMTSENSSMYGNPWGFQSYQPWPVAGQHNYLFTAMDLSIGVETGLSNSLSLLIAPYMKVPTRGVGYGQVQMSSVGINFALKFAPVTSRKRK